MIALTSNLRIENELSITPTITLSTWGIKKLLKNIDAFQQELLNFSLRPISTTIREKCKQLYKNLNKLKSIGTDLVDRLNNPAEEDVHLEIEVDLFYEMMKIQSAKYMEFINIKSPIQKTAI